MIALILVGLLAAASLQQSEAHIGVCYGLAAESLPPPEEVVSRLEQNNITRFRLYEPNQGVLKALKGKNIEVIVGVPNTDLENISISQETADSWVRKNIKDDLHDVKFRYIVVGSEISSTNLYFKYSFFLVKAMENIRKAVSGAGLEGQIKVTTVFDMSILQHSVPPSNASFHPKSRTDFLDATLNFLSTNKAPLLMNIYPYFSYTTNKKDVTMDYALFNSSSNVVTDGKLEYQNMFDAMMDGLYSALEKVGNGSLEVVVAETGWPSAGGRTARLENEKTYITNLIQHVKKGTPKRPGKPIEAYVNSMFDEDMKDGPEIERHFGLFGADKQLKFPLASE